MASERTPSTPIWVSEEPWLQELLHWFLDCTEKPRKTAITRRVNKKNLPQLFDYQQDTNYHWSLIQQLQQPYQVIDIPYSQTLNTVDQRYANAQLRFNPEAERLLRAWLNRAKTDPLHDEWVEAVAQHAYC